MIDMKNHNMRLKSCSAVFAKRFKLPIEAEENFVECVNHLVDIQIDYILAHWLEQENSKEEIRRIRKNSISTAGGNNDRAKCKSISSTN